MRCLAGNESPNQNKRFPTRSVPANCIPGGRSQNDRRCTALCSAALPPLEGSMTQLLSQVSESITVLVANAAPLLTAIRVGQNKHVTGFLWRSDLGVTSDHALPAAASYTLVLSRGALISAQPGPRDPVHNLASLRLRGPGTRAGP